MKSIILTMLLGAVVVLCIEGIYFDVADAENLFEQFIQNFSREYKDDEDRKIHFEAFKVNLEKINQSNKDNPEATFGITQFADYTKEEVENGHQM